MVSRCSACGRAAAFTVAAPHARARASLHKLGMRHWNVSFEPIRSVFIGSVHDRITEVVGIGSGGFACLVLVRRRLHRRSFATLKDKGNFKDVCKRCSYQSRRSKRKTLLFGNTMLSAINECECEEVLSTHHGSSSTRRPTGAFDVGGELALESAYRSTALSSRTPLNPSDDDDDGGVSFARGDEVVYFKAQGAQETGPR